MFQLDVLQAKYGDCLLLHCGGDRKRRYRILIDGGPAATYAQALEPRLSALKRTARKRRSEPLWIDLVIVSHIDTDHIGGLIKLFGEVDSARVDHRTALVKIGHLWHNSFPDTIGESAQAAQPQVAPARLEVADLVAARLDLNLQHHGRLVLEGIPQGRALRDQAKRNRVPLNRGVDGGLVLAGEAKTFGDTSLRVLAPTQTEVDALKAEWAKKLPGILAKEEARRAKAAQVLDTAIANLSSIVVLAEQSDRRMLLTGDARGDMVLQGLRKAALLDDGRIHVDLFKWPHHGSIRNFPEGFFRHVTADHHVVSADGRHGNPDLETFQQFFAERPRDRSFTLHMTYGPDDLRSSYPSEKLKALFAEARIAGHDFTINAPQSKARWLSINL